MSVDKLRKVLILNRLEVFKRIKAFDTEILDVIIEFCEKEGNEDFMEILVACKFQPLAFYGYLKCNGNIEKLKKVVEICNEKAEGRSE